MNLEKLTEATINALYGKIIEDANDGRIHIVVADARDDWFNSVDEAIKEYEDVYGSLMSDDENVAEYIFQPIIDWLYAIKDDEISDREYVVTQDEFDDIVKMNDYEEDEDDVEDIDKIVDGDLYYDYARDDTASGTSDYIQYCYKYDGDTILEKQYITRENWDTKSETIDEFPTAEQIMDKVVDGSVVVILNDDYAFGYAKDVISVYAEYTNNKYDPMMNCYNLSNKAKKQISAIKNEHKPYKNDYMYMGVDSDNLLYGDEAKAQFTKAYNEKIENKFFSCYLWLLK